MLVDMITVGVDWFAGPGNQIGCTIQRSMCSIKGCCLRGPSLPLLSRDLVYMTVAKHCSNLRATHITVNGEGTY
jgi:hypothetical protein